MVLVSFDGAADWILDRLIARGKAPAFDRLARDGARADAMVSVLPTLTAPAHATLWTGVSPRLHSVVGNNVLRLPKSAQSLLDSTLRFRSRIGRRSDLDDGCAGRSSFAGAAGSGHTALPRA